jgi:hypothetical protein
MDLSRAWARLARAFRPSRTIKIGANIDAGQVQHLTPKPPALLDLRLCFRRPSGKFPVRVAGLRYPPHGCLERRVLKLEMNAKAR